MRRKDRQVKDLQEILAIMEQCDVCHIALFDNPFPYIVTMNFGISHKHGITELYFHCAPEGKKLDLIRSDPHVAFEMDCSHRLVGGRLACGYTMEYESVCGTGIIEVLPICERLDAMNVFMRHYSQATPPLESVDIEDVCALKLTVRELTAKRLIKQRPT